MKTKERKKLLIVESPAKAKTIKKYLGSDFDVIASVGHVRDLPKSNKKAIDIEAGFIPKYEITKGKEKVLSEIKTKAKESKEVILATDPDREGEAIAWHISESIGLKKPKRVIFNEITKDAIIEALKQPRQINENLKTAQEARRVLDRLVGYDLSGLIWKKVRYGLSAGRVQSPALRIIMEREREIRNFQPEKYWTLTANLSKSSGETFSFICEKEPRNEDEALKISDSCKKGIWTIKNIKETKVSKNPRPPFITSTLQQAASSQLGMSPSKTMSLAQKLYEDGHITYMRTDSTNLGQQALTSISKKIREMFGEKYLEKHSFSKKSKNAQEAHEAIRPTNPSNENAGSTEEQNKLYKLIWRRTLASQMKKAQTLRTKISSGIEKEEIPLFHLNGSRIIFDGWLKIDPHAKEDETELPEFTEGEKMNLVSFDTREKETAPPGRYSEAGLVKELEKRGIGRPSTYASILKTLSDRGYVEKINRSLHPTDTGDVVSSFLEDNFKKYISDDFTAKMEDKLDDISTGNREYIKTLKEFYDPFLKELKKRSSSEKITNLGDADKKWKCPTCESPMIIKLGRSGKFMSCQKFPECTGARTIEGQEITGPKETGKKCPKCDDGVLVERDGRFGKFIACNKYPKCKHIEKDPEEEEKSKTGIFCPDCKMAKRNGGEMVERRGRFGTFYSCSNYPECRNSTKTKPTGKICKMCGSLMMDGTKTIPERCSNKMCPNYRPDRLNN